MKKLTLLSFSLVTLQTATAGEVIDLASFPQEQINFVAESIKKDLTPWGTKVKNPKLQGSVVLDDEGYLSEIFLSPLSFDASLLFFSTNAAITMHALVNKQCNAADILDLNVTGTSKYMDGPIRSTIESKGNEILLDYVIKLTDLSNFCAMESY